MKTWITLEEAQEALLEKVLPAAENHVPLLNAVGRVLCQDIKSKIDLPNFNKSPLDGYAVIAGDTREATKENPVKLKVIEEIRAGFVAKEKVVSGTAIKVMTGAPMPEGADEIIKYEDVIRKDDYITLSFPLTTGKNIIRVGEDVVLGEKIARKGTLITPPLVGLLAAVGVAEVPVYEKIKAAILSTGDELFDPAGELIPGKIYNSNLHSIAAACLELGVQPAAMGIVPDEKTAITSRITKALVDNDIVITTGGVSVGDFDIVPDALKEIGAEIIFHGINIKPGSPIIAAVKDKKLIIGLSGNPAAALITFELIVVPLLKKMMGLKEYTYPKISAILTDSFTKSSQQRRFLRAKISVHNGQNSIKLTGGQTNGVLKSMIGCNAFIDVPAGSGPLKAGQKVSALVIGNASAMFIDEACLC